MANFIRKLMLSPKPGSCEFIRFVWLWTAVCPPSRHALVSLSMLSFICGKWTVPISIFLLDGLNNLVRTIFFQVEWNDSGKWPFLGVLLSNVNGSLRFSFYRKPIRTAHSLPFSFSNHPLYIKKSVASSVFLRAFWIWIHWSGTRRYLETFSKWGYARFFLSGTFTREM